MSSAQSISPCPNSSQGGVEAAASLLRIGRLRKGVVEESFVLEVDCDTPDLLSIVVHSQGTAGAAEEDPVVEGDLAVQDFDSSDEVELHSGLLHALPAPTAARRLMQARAQQCVVCMEEKEHTFVPPHCEEPEAVDQHVAGHRFCTECWVEFLYHALRQQRQRGKAEQLACPCCRRAINAPDVWVQRFELPTAWRPPSPLSEEKQSRSSDLFPAHPTQGVMQPYTWAEAPSSTGSLGGSSIPSSPGTACDGVDSDLLRCLKPAWHSNCMRRLCETLSGKTRAVEVETDDIVGRV